MTGDIWLGLSNPDSVICDDSACDALLFWADGTQYDVSAYSTGQDPNIRFNSGYIHSQGFFINALHCLFN